MNQETYYVQLNTWTDKETGQSKSNIRIISSNGTVIVGQAFMLTGGSVIPVNLFMGKKKSKKTSSVEKPKRSKKTSTVLE